MATRSLTLDEATYNAAALRARQVGTTPEQYVARLIAVDALAEKPFDEILTPVRRGFEHLSDEQLDRLLDDARDDAQKARGR